MKKIPQIAWLSAIILILGGVSYAHARSATPPSHSENKATSTAGAEVTSAPVASDASISVVDSPLLKLADDEVVLGKKEAPITIIEYASMSCSHCAEFHNEVFNELKERYIDTGKARFVMRPFPLNAPALMGAMLNACVPKENYYKMVKVLFKTQDEWAFTPDFQDHLKKIAKLAGVDDAAFDTCIADDTEKEKILNMRLEAGNNLGIKGTPAFFINGTQYPSLPMEKLAPILDALL